MCFGRKIRLKFSKLTDNKIILNFPTSEIHRTPRNDMRFQKTPYFFDGGKCMNLVGAYVDLVQNRVKFEKQTMSKFCKIIINFNVV